jgi:hypothetical protein
VIAAVRADLGAVAALKTAHVVAGLPKTRSGKILRNLLRKLANGEEWTVPPTIDDPAVPAAIAAVIAAETATVKPAPSGARGGAFRAGGMPFRMYGVRASGRAFTGALWPFCTAFGFHQTVIKPSGKCNSASLEAASTSSRRGDLRGSLVQAPERILTRGSHEILCAPSDCCQQPAAGVCRRSRFCRRRCAPACRRRRCGRADRNRGDRNQARNQSATNADRDLGDFATLIKDRHVQSLLDLADGGIPSLRVATFEARQSALTVGIRGIVPFDQNQTARDTGVGVYIDGIYLGRRRA